MFISYSPAVSAFCLLSVPLSFFISWRRETKMHVRFKSHWGIGSSTNIVTRFSLASCCIRYFHSNIRSANSSSLHAAFFASKKQKKPYSFCRLKLSYAHEDRKTIWSLRYCETDDTVTPQQLRYHQVVCQCRKQLLLNSNLVNLKSSRNKTPHMITWKCFFADVINRYSTNNTLCGLLQTISRSIQSHELCFLQL